MDIGERKKHILKAIIDDYIETAEPVGSRTIAKKYEMGISSATIRNEMADLEELGFLEQPHTSAGRIPSDLGYRYYVDKLINIKNPTKEEENEIKKILQLVTLCEIDNIIKRTTKLLSEVTSYTAAVLSPSVRRSSLKSIQLAQINETDVLAIIITDTAVIKHVVVKLPRKIEYDTLIKINNLLNDKLRGLSIEQIDLSVISQILLELKGYHEILNAIIPVLYESLKSVDCDVYLEGTTNIFRYPEYNDINKAKSFLGLLEKKDTLIDILADDSDYLKVSIGSENENAEVKDCSIVRASYMVGNKVVGTIGVIGPTRMDYSKVIGILKYIADNLNDILRNTF
ncbi:Heat-inducible transcription repressor HrcA [Caloramator mitchellensis]|uniref:Heat-inducible transcription repressor HrcA n=1 Tax=Caloramator mitchellensis TaxID=908809 RepID=A0A0R3JTD6_CALMK|nr:heat-inducible transcriptional repressor HrcA [Caloramator mitchellensis]KRQ86784.1 Heat-inducible transcription repressor HrcA [Caloramator mitchellensis]